MKTIATFWKTEEAHLLKLRLGQNGIASYLQDENITQLHPWRAAAIGGVRVQVDDADFEEALRVAGEMEPPPAIPCAPEASGAVACFACGNLIPVEENRCSECGWSYKDEG